MTSSPSLDPPRTRALQSMSGTVAVLATSVNPRGAIPGDSLMPDRRYDRRAFMKVLAYLGSQRLLPARRAAAASMNPTHRINETLLDRNPMPGKQPRGRVKVGNGTVL